MGTRDFMKEQQLFLINKEIYELKLKSRAIQEEFELLEQKINRIQLFQERASFILSNNKRKQEDARALMKEIGKNYKDTENRVLENRSRFNSEELRAKVRKLLEEKEMWLERLENSKKVKGRAEELLLYLKVSVDTGSKKNKTSLRKLRKSIEKAEMTKDKLLEKLAAVKGS